MDTATKLCSKCQRVKPLEAFNRHPNNRDGRHSYCRECFREYTHNHFIAHRDRYNERQRINRKRPECRARHLAYNRQYDKNKASPEKVKARRLLRNALDSGKVKRPDICTSCGMHESLEAHHTDYTQPLNVQWLCKTCHGKAHRRYTEPTQQLAMIRGGKRRATA